MTAHSDTILTCLYFRDSSFFTHRNALDGVIVSNNKDLVLFLNDKSSQYSRARVSSLARSFPVTSKLDPITYRSTAMLNYHLYMESTIDRHKRTEDCRLELLQKKYAMPDLQVFVMQYHSAIAKMPKAIIDKIGGGTPQDVDMKLRHLPAEELASLTLGIFNKFPTAEATKYAPPLV